MMSTKSEKPFDVSAVEKRRKAFEMTASFGLLLVAVGLCAPFATSDGSVWLKVFKYIYAAGALIYVVARVVGVRDPRESVRLRRMRRMEAWAGVAFCAGAFFWFYNASRFGESVFTLTLLRDTVMFTLAGAIIQIIAAWLISSRAKKEMSNPEKKADDSKKEKSDRS